MEDKLRYQLVRVVRNQSFEFYLQVMNIENLRTKLLTQMLFSGPYVAPPKPPSPPSPNNP